jgi:ParB-like chromosome segregation protein Spo0J
LSVSTQTYADGEAMNWANRIIGSGEEKPDQLLANPRNWRRHSKAQQDALTHMLDKVGWISDVIVNRQTQHVVDGHLRITLAMRHGEATIPVKYIDVSEKEEAAILATFDPLGAMAGRDEDLLAEILAEAELPEELEAIARGKPIPDTDVDKQAGLDEKTSVICPECGHEFTP